jgi:7,8-dihydropterin-6-yl-methyl-4-(beta-D-ribofuranosyl)aminobenzene 5'-phosphate synthase
MKSLIFLGLLFITTSRLYSVQICDTGNMDKSSEDITVTILYDNYKFNQELESDWGFACLIEGLDKTILFDTGGKGNILLSNMKKMGKDPTDVDVIFLSHIHQDHTGGIKDFLDINHDVKVFMPASFPENFKNMIKDKGADIVEISGPQVIIEGVRTTGEMGTQIIEQSLILATSKGSVIITGCAHPWIIDIIKKAAEISGNNILLAMGGFHLLRTSDKDVLEIIEEFRQMNIRYAGPTHCSGDKTLKLFKENYGENFISLGVGRVLKINEL